MVNIVTKYTGNLTHITSPDQIFTNVNTASNSSLSVFFLWTIFVIVFIGLFATEFGSFKRAFIGSSFVTFLLSWLFWIGNWISSSWMVVFAVFTLIGAIALYVNPD